MGSHIKVLGILLIIFDIVTCQTVQDIQILMDGLLTGYNRDIRPAIDQSTPVQVNLTFGLVAIQEFDEVAETFAAVGIMKLEWVDHRMTWDPSLYNNTYTVNIRKDRVWIPELVLSNPTESVRILGERKDWMTIRYYNNGYAVWTPGDVFRSACKVDVTYFPFDVQNCEFMFVPWDYTAKEVKIVSTETEIVRMFFSENGEWLFKSSKTYAKPTDVGRFSYYSVEVTIQRRPLFFLVNIVIPIIFMSFLNVLVFWVPSESGERVSYATTVLLAIAVFLTIVGDNMPKSSKPVSVLSYFLVINLVLSAFICVGAIFNLNVYFKHWDRPVPKWLDKFTKIIIRRPRPEAPKTQEEVGQIETRNSAANENEVNKKTNNGTSAISDVTGGVTHAHKPVTWREVSNAIDRVFGIIAVLWLLIPLTCFIMMGAIRDKPT